MFTSRIWLSSKKDHPSVPTVPRGVPQLSLRMVPAMAVLRTSWLIKWGLYNHPRTGNPVTNQYWLVVWNRIFFIFPNSWDDDSPPATWGLLDFITVVLLLRLLHPSSTSFSSSSASLSSSFSTTFASTPMFTSALPTLRQALRQLPHAVGTAGPQPGTCRVHWAPLDLNLGPSELSEHRWTSTWDPPSSVSTAGPQPGTCRVTAGPQPGTFRAQWAPLDINLGPAELSEHRWTSTWDLPISVSTAGPQRPDRMPEDICQTECQIGCQKICQKICQIEC